MPTDGRYIPTLDEHIAAAERRRAAAERRAGDLKRKVSRWTASLDAQDITQVPPDQEARADELVRQYRAAQDEVKEVDAQLAAFRQAAQEDRAERAGQMVEYATPAARNRPAYDRVARIGYEARTYRPDTDPAGKGFLLDVTRNFLFGDPQATQRLSQHMAEEAVERPGPWMERVAGDTTTTNWAGLTVPQYLVGLVADQIGAMRPFADLCCVKVPLPSAGLSLNFSKVTTGSSVALQAAQLDTVSATSLDDTLGSATVQTAAGSQNVSRQAIERGTGIEETTWRDLARKYAVALDTTLIQQATTGLSAVAQTVTYTSASPTTVEMWPYLYKAASLLEKALLGVAFPSHVVMTSARWNWLASNVASTWPTIGGQGVPAQMGGVQLTTEYGPSVRAILASGLKVVVDQNCLVNGSSQDEVYVVAADESMYLAEDPNAPLQIRAEQPNAASLGVLLVLYSYFSYFSRYANPASKIVGTGTAAPSGF